MPAIRPPPPTGTTIASTSGVCSRISSPIVPWPAITSTLSNGWMNVSPSRAASSPACARASVRSAPCRTTLAPRCRQLVTLMSAANTGITTVTGMPSRLRVVRDALRVVAGRRRDDAAPALLGREQQQRVARAALLEAAGALQVVELAVDVRAGELRQRDRLDAGRVVDAAGDARARGLDVGERDHRERRPADQNGSAMPGFAADEHAPELGLDALERRGVVGLEAQHDDGRRVRRRARGRSRPDTRRAGRRCG